MTSRTDPEYGQGTYSLESQAAVLESATQFAARLGAHFTSPGYTPPVLPAVALEVHQLSHKPEVDASQVVAVMQRDPVLAGRVLKIAQSAAFATTSNILSLKDAVVRLGLRNLAEIAWEVSLNLRIFRAQAYAEPMEMVRRHSTACAYLARMVANCTSIPTEYAFLCGLLHDIGMAAVLIVFGEQKETAAGVDPNVLAMVLRMCHQEASGIVARLWKLPLDVQLVLAHHHDVVINGVVHPLAAIVAVAAELASQLGCGVVIAGRDCDVTTETALRRARAALGIDAARMEKLAGEAKKLAPTFERPASERPTRVAGENGVHGRR